MRRRILVLCGVLLTIGLAVGLVVAFTTREPQLPVAYVRPKGDVALEPMCPWREPKRDLRRYYPGATAHREETWILSAGRLELARLLGRPPTPEEHVLHLNRVLAGQQELGSVITRRVKGSAGAIELVIALDGRDRVRGVHFQRMREPARVAAALTSPKWLQSLVGREIGSVATQPQGIPKAAAQPAQSVLDGVRSALAMVEVARLKGVREPSEGHH